MVRQGGGRSGENNPAVERSDGTVGDNLERGLIRTASRRRSCTGDELPGVAENQIGARQSSASIANSLAAASAAAMPASATRLSRDACPERISMLRLGMSSRSAR